MPATDPAPQPKPTITDPLEYCDLAVQMIDELGACSPSDAAGFEMFKTAMLRDRGLPPLLLRKSAAFCATFMEQLLVNPEAASCTFTVAPRRRELTAYVDAYLAERTRPTPTGDDRRDRALQSLATHRDEVCACADRACSVRVQEAYTPAEGIGGAPRATRDIADRMLDEIARCSGEMRFDRKK